MRFETGPKWLHSWCVTDTDDGFPADNRVVELGACGARGPDAEFERLLAEFVARVERIEEDLVSLKAELSALADELGDGTAHTA